ncbi:MAG: LamG-like jellyroll fold domain-containing protein, partial [Promethearchaeota archaeon]
MKNVKLKSGFVFLAITIMILGEIINIGKDNGQNISLVTYQQASKIGPNKNEMLASSGSGIKEYHWWKINEGNGTTVFDYGTAATNNIILYHNPIWVPRSAPNGEDSIYFNRSNSEYGASIYPMEISGNANRSLTFWFKSRILKAPDYSFCHSVGYGEHSDSGAFGSYLHFDGSVAVWLGDSHQVQLCYPCNTEWNFVVITHNGSCSKYYLNGNYRGQLNGSLNTISNYMTIGADPDFTGRFWDGYISDVRFFDVELTLDDIDWLYNNGLGQTISLSLKDENPQNPSIIINNGDQTTNSVLVTLTLSAEGATEMCFK